MDSSKVQYTNDFVTKLKASAVNLGYFKDRFLHKITGHGDVRENMPWLMRAIYIRLWSFDLIMRRFVSLAGDSGQIISLGAGFDTSFFRLRDSNILKDSNLFIEVDLPDVVQNKADMLRGDPYCKHLRNVIVSTDATKPFLKSANYSLISLNIEDIDSLTPLVLETGIDISKPTLIVAEYVLPYLEKERSCKVVEWGAKMFPNSIFVSCDSCYPESDYMQVLDRMTKKKTAFTIMPALKSFSTPRALEKRCLQNGWTTAAAINMFSFFCKHVDRKEWQRIKMIQMADDFELCHLMTTQLSLITVASKGDMMQMMACLNLERTKDFITSFTPNLQQVNLKPVNVNHEPSVGLIQRYGCASGYIAQKEGYLVYSGCCFSRPNVPTTELVYVSCKETVTKKILECDVKKCFINGHSRDNLVFSSLAISSNGTGFLFGGCSQDGSLKASSSAYSFKEIQHLKYDVTLLETTGPAPEPRWRHTSGILTCSEGNEESMIIFGGLTTNQEVLNNAYQLNLGTLNWRKCTILGDKPKASHSHCSAMWNNSLLMYGGLDEDEVPICSLYQISFLEEDQISFENLNICSSLPSRYSASCVLDEKMDTLIIVGGVDLHYNTELPDILVVNLKTRTLLSCFQMQKELLLEPVLLFGVICGIQRESKNSESNSVNLFVFGGGGVPDYLSLERTFYNHPFQITLPYV